ncbi:MAG TPA: hypothetical protein PKV73_17135 [Agriterribacter sp.]|nr:hypothetical protein [Agriterribacter sp.]
MTSEMALIVFDLAEAFRSFSTVSFIHTACGCISLTPALRKKQNDVHVATVVRNGSDIRISVTCLPSSHQKRYKTRNGILIYRRQNPRSAKRRNFSGDIPPQASDSFVRIFNRSFQIVAD